MITGPSTVYDLPTKGFLEKSVILNPNFKIFIYFESAANEDAQQEGKLNDLNFKFFNPFEESPSHFFAVLSSDYGPEKSQPYAFSLSPVHL